MATLRITLPGDRFPDASHLSVPAGTAFVSKGVVELEESARPKDVAPDWRSPERQLLEQLAETYGLAVDEVQPAKSKSEKSTPAASAEPSQEA